LVINVGSATEAKKIEFYIKRHKEKLNIRKFRFEVQLLSVRIKVYDKEKI